MHEDAELFHRACRGDAASLGLLLRRHEPAMRAHAYRLIGYGPDADDAVQEAALVAVTRLSQVRDPDAVGAWLRGVVRYVCLAERRRPGPVLSGDLDRTLEAAAADPAQLLDARATADWVWHAMEQLSPTLRIVVLLRHFTNFRSYETISRLCGIPVGTVRSRLHQAHTKLTGHLRVTADHAHADADGLARRHRHEAHDVLAAVSSGAVQAALDDRWSPTADVAWPDGTRTAGLGAVVDGITSNYSDGVRYRLNNVVASSDIVIWEVQNLNPADKPWHCPPLTAWTHFLDSGRVSRFRLFFAEPAALP